MKALGTQHIAEFINCRYKFLNDAKMLEEVLKKVIEASGLHQVKMISHSFEPVGVTVVAIISESHIGMHTYPESGHVSLDVFTCSDAVKQTNMIELLKAELNPSQVRIVELQRGNPVEIKDTNWYTASSQHGCETRYMVEEMVFSGKSEFQKIDIISNPEFGLMMFIDRELQAAENDMQICGDLLAEHCKTNLSGKNILILGGGDGSALNSVLKDNPGSITLVDIDPEVIKIAKEFYPEIAGKAFVDPVVNIINSDVFNIAEPDPGYDVVISDLTMHPEAFTRKERSDFMIQLFCKIASGLKHGGRLSVRGGASHDKVTHDIILNAFDGLFSGIVCDKTFIPSHCQEMNFYSAKKI